MKKVEESIKAGESDVLEFKRCISEDVRSMLKTVVAFANGKGGRIIFGVDDETREIVGIEGRDRWKLQDRITSMISDNCKPQVTPSYSWEKIGKVEIFIVEVPPLPNTPYYLRKEGINKGTYIRIDATTGLAEDNAIRELTIQGMRTSYDCLVEHSFPPLEATEIKKVCDEISQGIDNGARKLTTKQLLNWKLIERKERTYYPTVAFSLLLGKNLHFAEIQCARFTGVEKVNFYDRRVISGSVTEQIEDALYFLRQNLRCAAVIGDVYRRDMPEIPIAALKEAIVNAIVHRNYLIPGYIQVSVFDDRVEVTSPGGLVQPLTEEEMLSGVSRLRNPLLASVLQRMHIIEQWGSGVMRIFSTCRDARIPAPYYTINPAAVTLTFIRPERDGNRKRTPDADTRKTQEEQAILSYLKSKPNATRREIASEFHLTDGRVIYVLRSLQEKGVLSRGGSRRNGEWRVKE